MVGITLTTPFAGPQAGLTVLAGAGLVAVLTVAAGWGRSSTTAGPPPPGAKGRPSLAAWGAVTAVAVLFELATYVAGELATRHAFPTLSSLYDAAAQARPAKALVAVVWLVLGWVLFRRPPVGPRRR